MQVCSVLCTAELDKKDTRAWDVQQHFYVLSSNLFPVAVRKLAREVKDKVRNKLDHLKDVAGLEFVGKKTYREW